MIRVAAVGDLHLGVDSSAQWRDALAPVSDDAELLLLAGDLTRIGTPQEAEALAAVLRPVSIPIVAVLGNHDHHAECPARVVEILQGAGVELLEGSATRHDVAGVRVGIAGAKGFGGGFPNACGSEFGEPEMKAFIAHTRRVAAGLGAALAGLEADLRIALLHYAPVEDTLRGERCEIFPFLGSYLLGEAIDHAGADLVLHGHAHSGTEKGVTPGGIRVRNVAQPVIGSAYRLYCFGGAELECEAEARR
ncbi:MAG: metallophosphoesterase [Proteobacteria bacterium]|nr:MAG: metallophosphoesterase [Pseudomonadota bacterium]